MNKTNMLVTVRQISNLMVTMRSAAAKVWLGVGMIRAENLTKVYNGIPVVNSISLRVKKGEVFGFLGPNGAGKTTAISMMVGMIEPNLGRCLIGGIDVAKSPIDAKRIIGYLPDRPGFYPNLTGRQTMAYFSKLCGIEKREADRRIEQLLNLVGLSKVNAQVGNYSRGMKQRLGIAQALINDPAVVFLDEPTMGLDPDGIRMLRDIIKNLSGEGKTVFFSTHAIEEVTHVCSRIGIISSGKLVASGTPEEVRRKLQTSNCQQIFVKVRGVMPTLTLSGIIDTTCRGDAAVIRTNGDLTEAISADVTKKGLTLLELRPVEMSLEELFLATVYGGEGHEN